MSDKVRYSTINVFLYQKVDYKEEPIVYKKTFINKAVEAFKNGWTIVTGFVIAIINIWPILFIVILIFWKRRWIREKLKKK